MVHMATDESSTVVFSAGVLGSDGVIRCRLTGSIRQICYTCKVYGGPQVVAIVRIAKDRNRVICDHGNNLDGTVAVNCART